MKITLFTFLLQNDNAESNSVSLYIFYFTIYLKKNSIIESAFYLFLILFVYGILSIDSEFKQHL